MDRVSPEGRTWRGGKKRQRVGGLHWPIGDQRKPRGGQHCTSWSLPFYFLLLYFFKSLLPRGVKDTPVLLYEVDVSLRREGNLIQAERTNNVFSHGRIRLTIAPAAAAEIRYVIQQAVFHSFPFCHSIHDGVECETSERLTSERS